MGNAPNIIFVLADQLRYQSLGYSGDPIAITPNIDALARGGVNFSNALSSMPVCSAYRSSLFTGKYVTSTGMVINELRLNPDHHPRCFAHVLNDAGYATSYIGKWHMYANELGNHLDPKNSFIPPGKHRLGFDGFFAAYNFHHRYYGDHAYYHLDSPEKIHFPDGVFEADGQTDLAIQQIQNLAGGQAPFGLFLSFGTPHDPWSQDNLPQEYYRLFRDQDFPLPPNYRNENDEPYGDAWSNIPKDPQQIQEWKRVYYGMTANLDHNLGRILEAVRQAGIEEDTIFVFSSDHGECFGAHGRMKKNIFYDEACRVPFIVRYPGKIPQGSETDVTISNVDMMQTILGLAGLAGPQEAEGMDLSHCALGEEGEEPDFAFLQNTGACAAWENGHEWRGVRTKEHTYAVYKVDGREFLFNNIEDPYQMVNLMEDPLQAGIGRDLARRMRSKMESIQDGFEDSLYYRDHWISEDRKILRTATSG